MNILKTLLVGACAFGSVAAYGVPAKRGAFTVTQPDGTQLTITAVGDEFGHAFLTADDHRFVLESAGEYFFAKKDISTGLLVPSEFKATNLAARTPEQARFLETQTPADLGAALELNRSVRIEAMKARSASVRKAAANPSLGLGLFDRQFKHVTGSPRILVVLVNYTDIKFTTPDTYDYFKAMFTERGYSQGGATGSVLDWFEDASLGNFSPKIDLYGPIDLPHNRAYYGANDYYGNDRRPDQMARDAALILSQQGVDLSVYDNDGNGYVDNIFIYYAGVGEASAGKVTDSVWPHSWDLSASDAGIYEVGGVKINHYACTNEIRADGTTDGIGTFIHEFSHVMGLPDLYVTDYNSLAVDKTPGEYDVLDYGPYNNNGMTPPTYSAFARNALGWLNPLVITEAENINLHHILETNEAYMVNTSDPNEFFLFENRQQKGWDEFIPGHGMLIWHILYDKATWENNTVNNSANKQLVDIVEAIGSANSNRMAAYPFPGTANKTSFTSTTTPAFRTWGGQNINLPVTEIAEADGVISAKVAGGVEVGTPKAMRAQEVTANSFTASWLPVPGATDYLLTVSTVSSVEPDTDTEDFTRIGAAQIADGWTASKYAAYNKICGEAKPAYLFNEDGQYITTREFPGEVTKVTFWIAKCLDEQNGNSLQVLAGDKDSQTVIATVSNLEDYATGRTVTITDIPAGTRQVTFRYSTPAAIRVVFDDVTVDYGIDDSEVLPGYDGVSSAGATSIVVELNQRSRASADKYQYRVMAMNGNTPSRVSNTVEVEMPGVAGVEFIEADAAPVIKVDGRLVSVVGTRSESSVVVTDMMGRAVSAGSAVVHLPAAGVYVVRADGHAMKIAVK